MINKQNLWFVTLFSLILILGIYYLNIEDNVKSVLATDSQENNHVIEITESDILVALEVENEEEKQALLKEYQGVLLSLESSLEEKNTAYDNIQKLNIFSNDEHKIKKIINEKFKLNSFVKINDNSISVVISSNKHDTKLANDIIRNVQNLYNEEKFITVKFNK